MKRAARRHIPGEEPKTERDLPARDTPPRRSRAPTCGRSLCPAGRSAGLCAAGARRMSAAARSVAPPPTGVSREVQAVKLEDPPPNGRRRVRYFL